ncbi:unnamed protein product, partial [Ectocarpus sp. 12 AP-2014]
GPDLALLRLHLVHRCVHVVQALSNLLRRSSSCCLDALNLLLLTLFPLCSGVRHFLLLLGERSLLRSERLLPLRHLCSVRRERCTLLLELSLESLLGQRTSRCCCLGSLVRLGRASSCATR